MYATLQRRHEPADPPDPDVLRLRQIGGPVHLAVRMSTERPEDPDAFEVRDDHPLADAHRPAEVASVITFTGPVSPAVEQAGERAYRDRIVPGMADHAGGVRVLTLWHPELRRQVVITLATSLESLEEGGRRIGTMALLPGEDVALLPGPDHVELFRVER